MTGTGNDTYHAGSDVGVSSFLSTMYPCGSDSGAHTVTGLHSGYRAGSLVRSESGCSQGRSESRYT
jgi:hypothetical protein